MPYVGTALPIAAVLLGVFIFAGIALYGVLGSILYILILFLTILVMFASVTFFSWCLFVVLYICSQPLRLAGKDLKWRGLKRFFQEFLSKLINSAMEKSRQEALGGYSLSRLQETFGRIRTEIHEKHKLASAKEAAKTTRTSDAEQPAEELVRPLVVPGQNSMESITLSHVTFPVEEPLNDPCKKYICKNKDKPLDKLFWKPKEQDHWYEVNALQTPAHYYMHDGGELAEEPGKQGLAFRVLGTPNADACKSSSGQPVWATGVVQQLKKLSASWYGGMIFGPLLLFFVLGASREIPRMMSSTWLLGADQGWLACGMFASPPHKCMPGLISSGYDSGSVASIVIPNCQCLDCRTFDPVNQSSNYTGKVCGPIMGGCVAQGEVAQGECFGVHLQDWNFYQDVSGFCDCSANLLIYNQTVVDKAQSHSMESAEWLRDAEHTVMYYNYMQWQRPPPALQILYTDWSIAKSLGAEVNAFVYFLFVDTVLIYFSWAVRKTHDLIDWLTNNFYRAETLSTGVLGWFHKQNNTTVENVRVGVLAGRAGIAAAVGGITAIHDH